MLNSIEDIICKNAEQYYTTGEQELSDEEFDALVEKLKKENPDSELLKTGWGYKPINNKVKHKYTHIGSLKKIKYADTNVNDKEFNGESKFCISPKLDGMSVVLYYENGNFDKAVTRGDGEFGIDITDKVKNLKNFDKILNISDFTGAVRGEIYMSPSSFEKYKSKHPEAKNHRNSAIGIINGDDTSEYEYLLLHIYTLVNTNHKLAKQENNIELVNNFLRDNFYSFALGFVYKFVDFDLEQNKNELIELKDMWSSIYSIDGLVFSLAEVNQDENGNIIYFQKAFKFQDDTALTTVTHIEWEMSKYNAYIPVVCIEPVELEGTTVKRATGYNAKWIKDTGIHAGSRVLIQKAHQIIPQIVKVLKDN